MTGSLNNCTHNDDDNNNNVRWMAEGNQGWNMQTLKYDMMREYRNTVPVEQQDVIWEEVNLNYIHEFRDL